MRQRRWRRENLFNPYIVLADVTIATIVIFVVLLISSETRGEQARQRIFDISKRNDEIKEILLDPANKKRWAGISVAPATGPTTLLIRLDGNLWAETGELNSSGSQRVESVVRAIEGKCENYRDDNDLVEIRIEGHCDQKWTNGDSDLALELSLERAKAVRRMFGHRGYISVSGFGSDRPAYRTTPAVIRNSLDQALYPDLAKKLTEFDQGKEFRALTGLEWEVISRYLSRPKERITDRIDLFLVYRGLSTDNNFVYPRVPSDTEAPPDWVNDVSWPKTDQRFLRGLHEDGAS